MSLSRIVQQVPDPYRTIIILNLIEVLIKNNSVSMAAKVESD